MTTIAPKTAPSEFAGKTADQWKRLAKDARKESLDSFRRSDTDGFLSQWANDTMAHRYDRCADVARDSGTMEVRALFDLDGNHVPARQIDTPYGGAWLILDPENPSGRGLGFFNESNAQAEDRRRKNNARKGYYIGAVRVTAYLDKTGSPQPTEDVVAITDNGLDEE